MTLLQKGCAAAEIAEYDSQGDMNLAPPCLNTYWENTPTDK